MRRSWLLLTLLLAACGSDDSGPDLTGVYAVTYHTAGTGDCQNEGPAVTDDPPYFQMALDDFLGFPITTYTECTSADVADCTGDAFSFQLPIDNGWRSQVSVSSGFDTCFLSYLIGTAIVDADGTLSIEMKEFSEEETAFPGDDERCDPDEATRRGESMPCDSYEVVIGSPIASN